MGYRYTTLADATDLCFLQVAIAVPAGRPSK